MTVTFKFQALSTEEEVLGATFKVEGASFHYPSIKFIPAKVLSYFLEEKPFDEQTEAAITSLEKDFNISTSELRKAFGKIKADCAAKIYSDAKKIQARSLTFICLDDSGDYALFHGKVIHKPVGLLLDTIHDMLKDPKIELPDQLFVSERELLKAVDYFAKQEKSWDEKEIEAKIREVQSGIPKRPAYSRTFMRDGRAWAAFSASGWDMKPYEEEICEAPEIAIRQRLTSVPQTGERAAWEGHEDQKNNWRTQTVPDAQLIKALQYCEAERIKRQLPVPVGCKNFSSEPSF